MLVLYQVATVIGIICGYLVAWALADTGSWRWMLGLAAVPGVVIFVLLLRLPDTARWYMMRGRRADAASVLARVDPDADVVAELDDIEAALAEEQGSGTGTFANLREMFRKPFLRATLFVVGLGFFVQITGINAIVYYSPRIFQAMGFEGNFALLGLPALVQVAGLAAVFVSMFLVDRIGRRPILLTGIGIMIIANILLVAVFTVGSDFGGALTALGFLGLLLFTVGFTFGFGALVWVYAGESFPARLRSLGSSAMLTSNLVANVAVAAFFLTLLTRVGGAGTFVIFGLLAVAAFVFVFKLAPETKGRPLDDIRHFWENGGTWPTVHPRRAVRRRGRRDHHRRGQGGRDHGRLSARDRHRRVEDPGAAGSGRCRDRRRPRSQRQPGLGRPRRRRPATSGPCSPICPPTASTWTRSRRSAPAPPGSTPPSRRPGSPPCWPRPSPARPSPSCTTPSCCWPPPVRRRGSR